MVTNTLPTLTKDGTPPKCRLGGAGDVFFVADLLRQDDWRRDVKRATVYKCYKRLPPTDYSQLAAKQIFNTSNVPWGMMTYRVNEQKSGYIDMVTDRSNAARINTKFGNAKERIEWSNFISNAWDMALWEWRSYFYNTDQTLEEMLLFGKGIELREEKACWYTRSYHNSQILVPDGIRANLDNLEEFAIKDRFKPVEFWNKFKNSKDNPNSPWNYDACVDALRWGIQYLDYRNLSNEDFLRRVTQGQINLTRFYNRFIDVFTVYVKEYDGSITKCMVLRDGYSQIAMAQKIKTEDEYLNKAGFLFCQQKYEPAETGFDDIIYPFHGAAGSGKWHDITGYAEDIFPQCRQYDITQNKIVDAINFQTMVILKGGSADQSKKLAQMEWGRYMTLPQDVDFVQNRIEVPIRDSQAALQSIMGDMDRGMANYNMVQKQGNMTARQSELDFAQMGKLDGTQLRRYNLCQTNWQKGMFFKFITTKSGHKGYKSFQVFKEYLKLNKVPDEAWKPENIESVESNFLTVTGANKVIALEKVVDIAGSQSVNEGEYTAKQMLVSSLIGPESVEAILPNKPKDIPDQQRVIGFENDALTNPSANPENIQVQPTDNHVEHLRGHFSDAMYEADQTLAFIQQGFADAKSVANAAKSLMNKGGHMEAHLQFLEKDESKVELAKTIRRNMESQLKPKADELLNAAKEMQEAEPNQGPQKSKEELDLEYQAAKNALDLEYNQKKDNQKLATNAQKHAQKLELDKEKTAAQIGIERAKAAATAARPKPTGKPGGKQQAPKPVSDQQ